MQMAVENNMSNNSNKDLEDDEELAALRLAALNSRKSNQKNISTVSKQPETEVKYSTPIVTVVKSNPNAHVPANNVPYTNAQASVQNNPYSWRKPRWHTGQSNKSSQRSNLIVISPIPMQGQTTSSNKVEKPALVLPQHKWFHDTATDESSSPKTFRKMGPTRFNRHGSDSDSSDVEIDDIEGDDSCSRFAEVHEQNAKCDFSPIRLSEERELLADSDTLLADINDDEHLSDDISHESVIRSNPRTPPSPLVKSTLSRKEITNGDFSDTQSESELDSDSKYSLSCPARHSQERSKTPPVRHFEDVANDETSTKVVITDCKSIDEQKKDHFNQSSFELKTNLQETPCKSEENSSLSVSKAETNLCVPIFKSEISSSSEKLDSSPRDCIPKLATHGTKLSSSNNDEIKYQPLPSTDLRFALKKRREERQQAEDADGIMTRRNTNSPVYRYSKSSGGSRSSCSRDSSTDSSSSSDFAMKSVSSIVKAVHPDKVQDVKEPLQQSKVEHGQDRHYVVQKSFKRHASSSSAESAGSDNGSRSWNALNTKLENKLKKYSSGIKVQLSEVNQSCDVAPDNKARVPVHLRLGNLPQKRIIQMTDSSRFSDSDDSNNVNKKCKKQNLKIITEVYQDETVDNTETKKKRKKRSHHRSSKEKLWKKSSR